jgi:uncharacterized protein YndB with AHSA1/START domain
MISQQIERQVLIDAPIDVVWAVVTQPEHISGWFSESVELELRPGGKLALRWSSHRTFEGRVERVDPPHAFSFRWVLEPDQAMTEDNSTLVEFSLSAEGDSTRLTVVESGFPDLTGPEEEKQSHFDAHSSGWDKELGELDEYLRKTAAAENR